jgi:UMF1 family MFS transporter
MPPALTPTLSQRERGSPREVLAWALYDWANSAYSTISITVLVSYVKRDVLPGKAGILLLGAGLGVTTFVCALASPVLGAVADAEAGKRRWLAITALTGAAASACMFFATPDLWWLMIVLYVIALAGMELSQTFYNAFLPEIADDERVGRVSAWGYALGYVGGGLALALAIVLIAMGDRLHVPGDVVFRKRLGLLLMGLWWGGFSLPTLFVLRDRSARSAQRRRIGEAARVAFGNVGHTLRNIRSYRMLTIFMLGFLVYNDGVQTVISQASVFADERLKMGPAELGMVVLMIQFIAFPGALVVGWLGDRVGQKPVLMVCLAVWTVVVSLSFFITEKWHFWCMSAVAALVLGGTQSVSRAIMALMTPPEHAGEFFGFFNFSGKATSVVGPVFFSVILAFTENPNLALASLLAFFVVGWAIVAPLNVSEGRRQARQTNGDDATA